MALISALIAAILFALAAFDVRWESVDIGFLGLTFLALALVLGALPLPVIRLNRGRNDS